MRGRIKAVAGEPESVVVVSACLAGVHCRYDAGARPWGALEATRGQSRILPLCPEVAGGLGVPREPAWIVGGDGHDVLDGRARVLTRSGRDVTAEFVRGAEAVLAAAQNAGATRAVLKQRSPSCGVGHLADDAGGVRPGDGVTAALLKRNGITVTSDEA